METASERKAIRAAAGKIHRKRAADAWSVIVRLAEGGSSASDLERRMRRGNISARELDLLIQASAQLSISSVVVEGVSKDKAEDASST